MIMQIMAASSEDTRSTTVPCQDLVTGSREDYLRMGVPLYEASIKCNWKDAKAIFDVKPEYVRYSITQNGETPLHIAASSKADSKKVYEFVKNLVHMMNTKDLELQNESGNTALYLATVAGNVETVKIMVERNRRLLSISGADDRIMPLYAAVLFGNYDVVRYMYEESSLSEEEGWSSQTRGWLVQKCVDNDMFDVALKIIKRFPLAIKDVEGQVLGALARKPKAFQETKSKIMARFVNSAFSFLGFKLKGHVEKSALPQLKHILDAIMEKSIKEIDEILQGPPDSDNQDNKTVCGWAVQALHLQELITEHIKKIRTASKKLTEGPSDSTNQDTKPDSVLMQLSKLITKSLMSMHAETRKIISGTSNLTKQDNKPVSNMEHLALELQMLIFKHIANMNDSSMKIINNTTGKAEDRISDLQKSISEHIDEMEEKTYDSADTYAKETYSSRVLFIAAEAGNTDFLVELIRRYPDLIWKVNDEGLSIFHVAAKHRHEGVYNLLYEIGAMKDLITPYKDPKGNNMLHLVGKVAQQKRLEDVSGVALQMQLELLWFDEVKKMIPVSHRERENLDGQTPHELFTKEHKDLVTQGEKWMKGTASQCMVVAALIATIVFAATFTVPGGYDQGSGIPIFHSKATFAVFVVADAISLISSSTSILMFLSILTSRYAEQDFLKSLPRKLLWGLASLFLSITTMMVAFGVSFFVLYKKGLLWMPILICVLVVFPALLYVRLQSGLFYDVIRSTSRSRYLFKPKKPVLYYKSPKF